VAIEIVNILQDFAIIMIVAAIMTIIIGPLRIQYCLRQTVKPICPQSSVSHLIHQGIQFLNNYDIM
jgi:hypothetical protein